MSRKIIGVTVGTPMNPSFLKDKLNPVTSVNGVTADENGNVEINIPDSGGTPEIEILTAVCTDTNGNTKYGLTIKGPNIVNEDGTYTSNSATVWDGADGKPGASMYTFDSENGLAEDGTLNRSYVNVPEGFKLKAGDLLLDTNGSVYCVGVETDAYGYVARWTATFVYSIRCSTVDSGGNVENGIPPGGKAGQFLCKKSDEDYDVEWADFVIPEQYGLITYDQDKTITIT